MNSPLAKARRVGNVKDLATGILFILVGAAYAASSYYGLDLGSARSMGPGYFPLMLSGALVLLGVIVGVRSFSMPYEAITQIPLRAILLVSLAPIVLALTLRGLGFVPSVLLTGMVAALAGSESGLVRGFVIAACVTALSAFIFIFGLGLSAPMFGPWLGF